MEFNTVKVSLIFMESQLSSVFTIFLYLLYFPLSITLMSTFSYNYSSIIFIKGSTSLGFPLQVQLRLDTLSFLFLTLVTFLIPILLLISIKNIKKNIKFQAAVLLGMTLILIFTFLSFIILLFFFSFEIILTLTSFSLSQWGSKFYKIRSSFYLFLFTIFGSLLFLTSIIILLFLTGSNNCTWDFSLNVNQQIPMTLPFTFALGIKLPIFPFHL